MTRSARRSSDCGIVSPSALASLEIDDEPRRDNDVDLETNEFGDECREAICFSFRPQFLDDNVFSFDVPKLAQSLTKCIGAGRVSGGRPTAEKSYPGNLRRLLRLHGERRKSEAESENDREPDQPHGHLVRRYERRVLASVVAVPLVGRRRVRLKSVRR